jgi:hypothetical protein
LSPDRQGLIGHQQPAQPRGVAPLGAGTPQTTGNRPSAANNL